MPTKFLAEKIFSWKSTSFFSEKCALQKQKTPENVCCKFCINTASSQTTNKAKIKILSGINQHILTLSKKNVSASFYKQTPAELKKRRTRVMQKFFVGVYIFFALKARLHILKFESCQIKLG